MQQVQTDSAFATCAQGVLAGVRREGVDAFFNIPYAAGFSGMQRFTLPRDPLPWSGVRDAREPGPVFPQSPSRLSAVMGTTPGFGKQSEDAASLNVWAPAGGTGHDAPLPVLVWIHGGGWLTGGAPLEWYHGDRLAASGRIVVVGVNYRLGALGNLYLPGHTPGSMALHDLCAALRWIRENIAAFGGDASRVTVCGQSAGAWYTAALTSSPMADDLFDQAILLSLPGSIAPQTPERAATLAHSFCDLIGAPPDGNVLKQLPIERILEGQGLFARAHPSFAAIPPTFLPIVSEALPADLTDIDRSRAKRMRFLLGSLPDEMGAFFSLDPRVLEANDADTRARFTVCYGDAGNARFEAMKRDPSYSDSYRLLLRMVSDEHFRAPTQRLADRIADAGGQCFVYEFTQRSTSPHLGACHCLELPYLFDRFDAWANAPMLSGIDIATASKVSRDFQASILDFTVTGDPNGGRLPRWPRYASADRQAMRFGEVPAVGTFAVDHTEPIRTPVHPLS